MANKPVLGAAGVALIAATGLAQATAVAPFTGPTAAPIILPGGTEVAVQIDKTLNLQLGPGYADWRSNLAFEVDFQRPIGWSFEIVGDIGFNVELPIDGGFDLSGRAYRSFGNFEVGFFAGFAGGLPLSGIDFHFLGGDVEYRAGRLTVFNETSLGFNTGAGLGAVQNVTQVEFDVNDRLTVGGDLILLLTGGPAFAILVARAELDLGMVDPYAFAALSPTAGGLFVGAGADFERPIRSGPFSLIGNAEFQIGMGGLAVFGISGGIRYSRGDVGDQQGGFLF